MRLVASDDAGRQCYVGNLSFNTEAASLEAKFAKFGTLNDVFIPNDAGGKPRGFAFITFTSAADAEDACAAMEGQDVDGRTINCQIARARPAQGMSAPPPLRRGDDAPPRRGSMSKRIYVEGLPEDIREREVDDFYYKCGRIARVEIRNSSRSGHYVVVEFEDARDAAYAVRQTDGVRFERQRLKVELAPE
ncbi:hypothetical protein M885DRAFT_541728 [Pelagophyceae sp. CCMP2097]|nr:hypothetical protein M885DRAFT_541728 [Pelagophyceae sp. CCMP2097]